MKTSLNVLVIIALCYTSTYASLFESGATKHFGGLKAIQDVSTQLVIFLYLKDRKLQIRKRTS